MTQEAHFLTEPEPSEFEDVQVGSGVGDTEEGQGALVIDTVGGGPVVQLRFKMRALADPGPGYVVWVVQGAPDFVGAQAPGAIQPGTAVVADTWES